MTSNVPCSRPQPVGWDFAAQTVAPLPPHFGGKVTPPSLHSGGKVTHHHHYTLVVMSHHPTTFWKSHFALWREIQLSKPNVWLVVALELISPERVDNDESGIDLVDVTHVPLQLAPIKSDSNPYFYE